MRRLILAAALAMGVVTPVRAELPPYVYEQARAAAPHVIVLRIDAMQGLPEGQDRGSCAVSGVIEAVERGTLAVGERATIRFPCIGPGYRPMPGPFPGYSAAPLSGPRRARLWTDGAAVVLRGMDILPDEEAAGESPCRR